MKVTVKVNPIDINYELTKQLPEDINTAALFAVRQVGGPIVGELAEDYKSLPVAHPAEQAKHRSRPATRNNGTPRPHVWQDITIKTGNYNLRTGAFAVIGATTVQPHLHFIEAGTQKRQTKAGHNRGRMPAFRVVLKMRNNKENFIVDRINDLFVSKLNAIRNGG